MRLTNSRVNFYLAEGHSFLNIFYTTSSVSLVLFEIFHELANEFKYRIQYDIIIFSIIFAPILLIKYLYRQIFYFTWNKITLYRLNVGPIWFIVLITEIIKILIIVAGIHFAVFLFWICSDSLLGIPFHIIHPPLILREMLGLWIYEGGAHITAMFLPVTTFVWVIGTGLEFSFAFLIGMLFFYLLFRVYRHAFYNIYFGNILQYNWYFWLSDAIGCMLFMNLVYEYNQDYIFVLDKRIQGQKNWPKRYVRKMFRPEGGHFNKYEFKYDPRDWYEWHDRDSGWKYFKLRRNHLRRLYTHAYRLDTMMWFMTGYLKYRRRIRKRRKRRSKQKRRRSWFIEFDWEIFDDIAGFWEE